MSSALVPLTDSSAAPGLSTTVDQLGSGVALELQAANATHASPTNPEAGGTTPAMVARSLGMTHSLPPQRRLASKSRRGNGSTRGDTDVVCSDAHFRRFMSMQARYRFLHARRLEVALLGAALNASACAKDGDAEGAEAKGAEGSGSVTTNAGANIKAEAQAAVTVQPKLGGSVIAIGESQVEVAVFEDGSVKGLVYDAQGKPLGARAAVDFAVTLQAANGNAPKVDLSWNDACACFAGQAELQGALAVRPIDVSLGLAGSSDEAKLETYALLPAPKLDVEANKETIVALANALFAKPVENGQRRLTRTEIETFLAAHPLIDPSVPKEN